MVAVILDAASALFSELSYEKTSMSAIAARVGITAPALYHHFPSKRHMLFATLERALSEMVQRAAAAVAVAGADPVSRLWAFAVANVLAQIKVRNLQLVYETATYNASHLANALSKRQRDALRNLQREYLEILRAILRNGQKERLFSFIDLNTTAFSIFAIGEYVLTWFNPQGPLSGEQIAERIAVQSLRLAGSTRIPAPR